MVAKSRKVIAYRGRDITRVESLNRQVFWYVGNDTTCHYRLKDARAAVDAEIADEYAQQAAAERRAGTQ